MRPLARSTPCLRIPSRGALPLGEVEAAFAALGVDPATPEGERPYVHLCVALDGPAVGVKSEVDAIAERFPIRLVSLSVERPQKDSDVQPAPLASRLVERAPVDLFCEAFEREHNVAPSSDHLTLFHAAAATEGSELRILAICGEKLASLADRFEIDFEREPLRGAGLFAITGETGAGKSTILDALCLALYDNFPRVGSQGGDAGALDSSGQPISASDPRSILRRGASRGFAEVDFLARNGLRYRARCELMRARGKATGNLQPRARSLHEIDDAGTLIAPVASGVEPVREKIVELTDLTFEQFRRTVLLAQGDFDAFLRANSNERAELLEKITGASIYAIISKHVFQRTKDAENGVVTLKQRLDDIRLLDAESREGTFISNPGRRRQTRQTAASARNRDD